MTVRGTRVTVTSGMPVRSAWTGSDREGALTVADNLQVQYGTLESAAARADATAEEFLAQLNQLESQVRAMVWQGGSGTAFQGYFDTVKNQLRPVQDTLHGLATQIRGAARQLQETDAAVAQQFQG